MMNLERSLALYKLLALPDPPELRRRHILRFHGKPDRFQQIPVIMQAFVQAKLLAIEGNTESQAYLRAPATIRATPPATAAMPSTGGSGTVFCRSAVA
jgi:hypothetical protein